MTLLRVIVCRKMVSRPKRSIARQNYQKLADVKLPKKTFKDNSSKSNSSTLPEASVLYRLRELESDGDLVKVRYIGYGSKYDEWRGLEDIVNLEYVDENSDES